MGRAALAASAGVPTVGCTRGRSVSVRGRPPDGCGDMGKTANGLYSGADHDLTQVANERRRQGRDCFANLLDPRLVQVAHHASAAKPFRVVGWI